MLKIIYWLKLGLNCNFETWLWGLQVLLRFVSFSYYQYYRKKEYSKSGRGKVEKASRSNGSSGRGSSSRDGATGGAAPCPTGGRKVRPPRRWYKGGCREQDQASVPHWPTLRRRAPMFWRKLRPRNYRKSSSGSLLYLELSLGSSGLLTFFLLNFGVCFTYAASRGPWLAFCGPFAEQ